MIEKLLEPLIPERFRNEEKYRHGHIRILNPLPGRAVMGLHIPDMRKVAKTLAGRGDASTIIADFGKESEKGRKALSHEELIEVRAAGGPGKVLSSGRGVVIGESPYYVRMGVAWFLATALAKFPDDTRGYLRHSCLPEDVLKLYARKARESFRTRSVSPF